MNLTKIFINPNRWLKSGNAQHKDGTEVPMTAPYKMNEKEPYAFSLQGVVSYYTDPESQSRTQTMERLSKAISAYTGRTFYVAEWNNSPETTFQDLLNVIKIYNKIQ